jgi:hypothetical protein
MHKPSPFERDQKYYYIQSALFNLGKQRKTRRLNIHIPGTGCRENDLEYATRAAFEQLRLHVEQQNADPIPMIFLEGVAASGQDYVPPVMRDTHTLANKQMSLSTWFKHRVKGAVSFCVDDWGSFSKETAFIFGKINGAGIKANNQTILHTLEALESDCVLPEEIYLSGYSRGAINCLSAAEEIYSKYGRRIKIHLCLADPVPGPMHEGKEYIGEKVIPPNVISFTCFYSPNEERSLYVANDLTKLVFANPTTTITSVAIADTDHLSIIETNGDIEAQLYSKDDESGIVSNLSRVSPIYWALNHLIFAINGHVYEDGRDNPLTGLFDQQQIVGIGPRKDSSFYRLTAFNDACTDSLIETLLTIRNGLDINTDLVHDKIVFADFELSNRSQRKEAINKIYKSPQRERSIENLPAFEQIKEINNSILQSGLPYPAGDHTYKIVYKDINGKSNTTYLPKSQFQQLEIIRQANRIAGFDSLNEVWQVTLEQLLTTWPEAFDLDSGNNRPNNL